MNDTTLKSALAGLALPLNQPTDLDPLIESIGDCKVVMLGEASHGNKEYYLWRNTISQRLIEEKGFKFISVEGDWPDCQQINQYIKGQTPPAKTGKDVLREFKRWPTWMWANEEVLGMVEWLRSFNQKIGERNQVGFYGLDIYSLWESLDAILKYLQGHNPQLLDQAYQAYQCFEPFGRDAYQYAGSIPFVGKTCEAEVVELLSTIRKNWAGNTEDKQKYFDMEQNAFIVKNAEHYYRTMLRGDIRSWNIRDQHMFETLERLLRFHGEDSKAIVWAHNSHIGDARFTDMKKEGLINIGQLAREKYPEDQIALVGFGSYYGTVIASRQWEGAMRRMLLPNAKKGSFEAIVHEIDRSDQLFLFPKEGESLFQKLNYWTPHRAVGVVYRPEREYGNYVPTLIPKRYDAFLYFDRSRGLNPLDVGELEIEEISELYPYSV